MADTKKEENNNSNLGIKELFIFLASGMFVKFHKEFLASSSETSWSDLGVKLLHQIFPPETHWFEQFVNGIHQILHTLIVIAIQIVLLLWIGKFIIVAWKAISVTRKGKKGPGE